MDRPDLVAVLKELDGSGWEIGLHGSLESYARPGLLQKEKDALEHQLGKAVISTRQHYLRFREGTTRALQEACGPTFSGLQDPRRLYRNHKRRGCGYR